MWKLSSQLKLSLWLLKLTGGFPYKKHHGIDSTNIDKGRSIPRFRKSKLWKFVDILLTFGHIASIASYYLTPTTLSIYGTSRTYRLMSIIYGTVRVSTVAIIGYYLQSKSNLVQDLIMNIYGLAEEIHVSLRDICIGLEFGVWFSVYLCSQLTYIYWTSLGMEESMIIFTLGAFFRIFFWISASLGSLALYHSTVVLICKAYDKVIHDLKQLATNQNNLNLSPQDFGDEIGSIFRDGITDEPFHIRERPKEPPLALQELFGDAERKVVRIHVLQRLLLRYFGLPILVMTIAAVVTNITFILQLSYLIDQNLVILLGTLFILFESIPICLYNNIPTKIENKVEDLKLTIGVLRRQKYSRWHKYQCDDLLKTLEETPGFSLCNVFTLGRGRILSIFSFIATYIIILLQFRITEYDYNEEQRNATFINNSTVG